MSWLEGALKYLVETGKEVQDACIERTTAHPGDPHKFFLVRKDGSLEERAIRRPPRKHGVFTVDSLERAVTAFMDEADEGTPSVWVEPQLISADLGALHRDDVVTLKNPFSAAFEWLLGLEPVAAFVQKDLVWHLRHTLAGVVDETLVPTFRRLEWKRSSDGRSNVEHGRESLGRSVEQSVQGAADLPEVFQVRASLWSSADFQVVRSIRVTVDLDYQTEQIRLAVRRDELEVAIDTAVREVVMDLQGRLEGVPVFAGRPVPSSVRK